MARNIYDIGDSDPVEEEEVVILPHETIPPIQPDEGKHVIVGGGMDPMAQQVASPDTKVLVVGDAVERTKIVSSLKEQFDNHKITIAELSDIVKHSSSGIVDIEDLDRFDDNLKEFSVLVDSIKDIKYPSPDVSILPSDKEPTLVKGTRVEAGGYHYRVVGNTGTNLTIQYGGLLEDNGAAKLILKKGMQPVIGEKVFKVVSVKLGKFKLKFIGNRKYGGKG